MSLCLPRSACSWTHHRTILVKERCLLGRLKSVFQSLFVTWISFKTVWWCAACYQLYVSQAPSPQPARKLKMKAGVDKEFPREAKQTLIQCAHMIQCTCRALKMERRPVGCLPDLQSRGSVEMWTPWQQSHYLVMVIERVEASWSKAHCWTFEYHAVPLCGQIGWAQQYNFYEGDNFAFVLHNLNPFVWSVMSDTQLHSLKLDKLEVRVYQGPEQCHLSLSNFFTNLPPASIESYKLPSLPVSLIDTVDPICFTQNFVWFYKIVW